MKLMIVESPNKIRKIREILGAGWEVAASVGHIRDLPEGELGVEGAPDYRPQYELTARGAEVVGKLRTLVARAEGVYLATDPDREGEAIAWHLAEALKLRGARRVRFDALTPEVVRRGVAAAGGIDAALVRAQEARRVLDRLVGYGVSPVLSRQAARRGLSAGRVQSPALRLVVDREREIDAFKETRHFGAELSFDGGAWRAEWETAPFLPKGLPEDDPRSRYILDEPLAARAAACRACRVLSSGNRVVRESPPPPFTTSTMLQAASVRLKWRPENTASVAQRLFEAGLITYHRTDSTNLSTEAVDEVRSWAGEHGLPVPARGRAFKSRAGAQEAHEAVRPTHFADERAGAGPEEQALYRLIWERAVASQLADAEWSVNTTRLEAVSPVANPAGEQERFLFKAEGRVLQQAGWRGLTGRDQAEEDEDEERGGGRVPVLPVGAEVGAESGRVLRKKTEPPRRYTQATLIKRLEALGIGRPSTYAAILKNVMGRGYMEEERRMLRPTALGRIVIDALCGHFGFAEYAFTRELEKQLDEIAAGRAEYGAVVGGADERLQRELAALGGPARTFSRGTRADAGARTAHSTGATLRHGRLPRRPEGSSSAGLVAGGAESKPASATRRPASAPAKERAKRLSATAIGTDSPGRKTAAKKMKKGPKAGNKAGQDASSATPCPMCGAGFLRLAREDAKFFGCTSYPACRFVVWRTVAGRPLSAAEVALLCREGRTGTLDGFLSKGGKPFRAALRLDDEGKTEFVFEGRA